MKSLEELNKLVLEYENENSEVELRDTMTYLKSVIDTYNTCIAKSENPKTLGDMEIIYNKLSSLPVKVKKSFFSSMKSKLYKAQELKGKFKRDLATQGPEQVALHM